MFLSESISMIMWSRVAIPSNWFTFLIRHCIIILFGICKGCVAYKIIFCLCFCYRDDDDINDVASMAGVNLNEENARIMATNSDLVGTQIQSCKDEPFLAAIPLHKRILEMGEKYLICF